MGPLLIVAIVENLATVRRAQILAVEEIPPVSSF
jgi:hypothetical protein